MIGAGCGHDRVGPRGSGRRHHHLVAGLELLRDVLQAKQSPQLLAKYIVGDDDPRVAMSHSEFLAAAWRLANHKARELGWIV